MANENVGYANHGNRAKNENTAHRARGNAGIEIIFTELSEHNAVKKEHYVDRG